MTVTGRRRRLRRHLRRHRRRLRVPTARRRLQPHRGNARLDAGEECDHGTAGNIGGYNGCFANCTRAEHCGDSHVDAPSRLATTESTMAPTIPVGQTARWPPRAATASSPRRPKAGDDGGTIAGDGCNTGCQTEPGFTCRTPGAPCLRNCGNGRLDAGETCDDSGHCADTRPALSVAWRVPTAAPARPSAATAALPRVCSRPASSVRWYRNPAGPCAATATSI